MLYVEVYLPNYSYNYASGQHSLFLKSVSREYYPTVV